MAPKRKALSQERVDSDDDVSQPSEHDSEPDASASDSDVPKRKTKPKPKPKPKEKQAAAKPASKSTASAKKSKKTVVSDEEEDAGASADAQNDAGEDGNVAALPKNDDGDSFLELSQNRSVTIRTFKGALLVDVRETYEKDGKTLPGKKGIALNKDQWDVLKAGIAQIDKAVSELS